MVVKYERGNYLSKTALKKFIKMSENVREPASLKIDIDSTIDNEDMTISISDLGVDESQYFPTMSDEKLDEYFQLKVKNLDTMELDMKASEFVFDSAVGSGAFGIVFKTTLRGYSNDIALKRTSKINLVQNEIAMLKKIGPYPNIIKIFGYFRDIDPIDPAKEILYVVMEYINGVNLLKFMSTFPDSPLENKYIRDIIRTVNHCHSKNVVHRDIKLGNVMFDYDNQRIVLIDFDMAFVGERKTPSGTPNYLAPEILKGKLYSKSIDVWSIGVMLYIIFSKGKAPFSRSSVKATYDSILKHDGVLKNVKFSEDKKIIVEKFLTPRIQSRVTLDDALSLF